MSIWSGLKRLLRSILSRTTAGSNFLKGYDRQRWCMKVAREGYTFPPEDQVTDEDTYFRIFGVPKPPTEIIIKLEETSKEELEEAMFKETTEDIKKLEETNNIKYIDNYAKKYYNHLSGTQEFEHLKKLLGKNNFKFENNRLELIICLRRRDQIYPEMKTKIFHNNPKNPDDGIRNYLEIYGESYGESKGRFGILDLIREIGNKDKEINRGALIKILIEEFDYKGDLSIDIERIKKEIELEKFETNLISDSDSGVRYTIVDIDKMSGYDFENLLKKLFEKMGYKVIHTSLSSDQGADLVIEKFGEKIVIQAKNWTGNVGNSAIQEVVASIKHYNAQRSMVITSSDFTSSAIDLARSNNVELWDGIKLSKVLDDNSVYKK
jgi:HJR/Mrr/RecB family endonuclease